MKVLSQRSASALQCVLICFLVLPTQLFSQTVTSRISLNQLGFYNFSPKTAVVTGPVNAVNFYITSTNLRDTLYTGTLGPEVKSAYSNTITKQAVFSTFTRSGSYVVVVPGVGHSYVFEIGNGVNSLAAISTIKGYYYQRVSMPLEEKFAGKWHRSAGHPDAVVYIHASAATKERPEGTIISSPGGWYDAGDYNKYIVNSGVSMGTIFSAYEDFPEYFKTLNTNIPESNDAIPDILNEALYNLRWMLTMQDPNDGGVYNKCTNAAFDGMVMPGITKAPRYVVQKGTAATLDFAAVTAQAARIFKQYKRQFPGLADSCLLAATKAWQWAVDHPAMEYNQGAINQVNKPEISTGGYGDRTFNDEWLWAAAELFVTTKEARYSTVVNEQMKHGVGLPSWANVGMLGYYTYLRFATQLPAAARDTALRMKERILNIANGYLQGVKTNAFATVMGQSARDFNWGGNSNAANQGNLLIKAYQLTGEKHYVDHALTNLDYLLGRNATGYCFVTGLGSKSPMHPHHRPSVGDGIIEPVPGLLVGGPNPGMQDKCQYEFTEPETAYADIDCSYASNEIAINWNAPMVYLANAVEALKTKVGYVSKQ
ncbi:cellulase [Segetibacter sp. 3557_3]|uniref:glycoside hydrolase family 9 protein n=1 Tax=Segetibacter sp. 3557_3 TaxID=2547429 RepID=UPI001058DBB9|nr:glycoside hydrolase family 9 protein [Segetibacter sp. 3557_3]TDH28541.1 cellulase [Segetibacter sp. 3557_3]